MRAFFYSLSVSAGVFFGSAVSLFSAESSSEQTDDTIEEQIDVIKKKIDYTTLPDTLLLEVSIYNGQKKTESFNAFIKKNKMMSAQEMVKISLKDHADFDQLPDTFNVELTIYGAKESVSLRVPIKKTDILLNFQNTNSTYVNFDCGVFASVVDNIGAMDKQASEKNLVVQERQRQISIFEKIFCCPCGKAYN